VGQGLKAMPAGILGATGFIGSYLSRRVAAHSEAPLRLLIRNNLKASPAPSAEVMVGDLGTRADCERFARGLDVIYYLAHTNTPLNSDLDPVQDAALNLPPLLNLLDAIRHLGAKPHIVYFSSGGALYAPRPGRVPYRESDACAPRSSYGILKLTAEQYLRLAADRGELTATVLRVCNAYGTLLPEYRLQGLIGVALSHLLHGKPVRVFGNTGNVRDYVHLDEVCGMALKASVPGRPFDIFNVGTGLGHSVQEVMAIIEDCYGAPFPIQMEAGRGQGLTDWVVLDCSRAREELGWSPVIDLRTGIARMLAAWNSELQVQSALAR
jgi:UDP-glucose 4-epimerase